MSTGAIESAIGMIMWLGAGMYIQYRDETHPVAIIVAAVGFVLTIAGYIIMMGASLS